MSSIAKILSKSASDKNIVVPLLVSIILAISAGVIVGLQGQNNSNSIFNVINIFGASAITQYKNGKYNAIGKYNSPEGEVSLKVNLEINNNIIETIQVIPNEGMISKTYQETFGQDVTKIVQGKSIDSQFDLTRVNNFSLTGIGFRNALERIKNIAKK